MVREIKLALALTAIVIVMLVFGSAILNLRAGQARSTRKLRPSKPAPSTAKSTRLQDEPRSTKKRNGKLVLRLTNFKTSNGPDVHVILIAAKDAEDDANFLKSDTSACRAGRSRGK